MNPLTAMELLIRPNRAWARLADTADHLLPGIFHTLIFSLLPPLCWYYGTTQVGWAVGSGEPVRLTVATALPICILFYLTIVAGIGILAFMVHWMAETYAGTATPARALTLVSASATPFCIAGLMGLYPMLWLDVFIGAAVAAWSIALLNAGVPKILRTSPERGFLYAGALLLVGLVGFVVVLCATVLLWDLGLTPEFAQ